MDRFSTRGMTLLIGALCALVAGTATADCAERTPDVPSYSVHVVPQRPAQATFGAWSPYLIRLGEMTGLCFDLVIPSSIPEFENGLLGGRADLAFANPYHLVMAREAHDYTPLLRDRTDLTGILVARRDSGVKGIEDLEGAAIAMPSPNAFGASILTQLALAERGIPIERQFVQSHTNVFRSVIIGRTLAGGAVNNTLLRERDSVKDQLEIIFETPGHPSHPLIARSTVRGNHREAIIAATMRLADDPSSAMMLDAMQIPEPIRARLDEYMPLADLPWDQ